MGGDPKRFFVVVVLTVFFILAAARFAHYVAVFGETSLQMDFAASYTAAESLINNLNPYANNLMLTRPVWDGYAVYKHSRFTYTPFTAIAFCPLALLPYHLAKYVWMLVLFLAVGFSVFIFIDLAGMKKTAERMLLLGIFLFLFFPLLAELERGQIDAANLILIVLAAKLMTGSRKANTAAGALLAIAVFFKLYCIYVVPFLIILKKWDTLKGCAITCFLLILLPWIFAPEISADYWTKQLPRISQYGEEGKDDDRLPFQALLYYLAYTKTPMGQTVKDGHYYRHASLDFSHNTTFTRVVRDAAWGKQLYAFMDRHGLGRHKDSSVSLTILGLFALLLFFLTRERFDPALLASPFGSAVYWQIVMIIILLSGVRIWIMNTVWLIPAAVLILSRYERIGSMREAALLALGAVGLILAMAPEHLFAYPIPFGRRLLAGKYVIAELCLLAALISLLIKTKAPSVPAPQPVTAAV